MGAIFINCPFLELSTYPGAKFGIFSSILCSFNFSASIGCFFYIIAIGILSVDHNQNVNCVPVHSYHYTKSINTMLRTFKSLA